jgi:hypothetical protein
MEAAHRGYIITANGFYDVAVVRDIGNEGNRANARLIAAAPDLLVSAICDNELSKPQPDYKVFKAYGWTAGESAIEFCDRLRRAAIAKAEGE